MAWTTEKCPGSSRQAANIANYVRLECGKCRDEMGWSFRPVTPDFTLTGFTLQDILCDICYDEELT